MVGAQIFDAIQAERLQLRQIRPDDASRIRDLISDWEVVRNLGRAPYPYTAEDARHFVTLQAQRWEKGEEHTFAIELPASGLIGITGVSRFGAVWEIGYWLGRDWWARGYVTEAASALLGWAETALSAERFTSGHYADNPVSGRVLTKLGFELMGEVDWFARARGETVKALRYRRGTATADDALRSNIH